MMQNRPALAAMALACFLAGTTQAIAQSATVSTTTQTKTTQQEHGKHKTPEQSEIERLNQKYDALENRIKNQLDEMQKKLDDRDRRLQQALDDSTAAQAAAQRALEQSKDAQQILGDNAQAVSVLQGTVSDLKANSASIVDTIQAGQKQLEHPDSFHYKGIEIKPSGFLAAETVWRRRGIGGDVNTQFTGVPFSGQAAGELSEFNASGRQSRLALLAEGKLPGAVMRGYYEADFLSAGVSSNDNQSNSYTLRQRQVWAQTQLLNRGLTFTGGQMWSLATEYKEGLTNAREATPLVIDAQYNVGFSWERQYGFRIVRNLGKKLWLGASIEEAQTLNIAGHNLPVLLFQQAGNGGGLYNATANYSYNRLPDLVGKVAYEPGFGHFELFAVGRFFRDRVYPDICWSANGNSPISASSCAKVTAFPTAITAQGAYNSNSDGFGLGANARVSLLKKKLDVGAHLFGGDGVGRYSTSTLSDVTAHPDGSLEPLQAGSALGSVEWHPQPRWDIYGYYGGEYVQRAYYLNPAGKLTGYGAPTNVTTGCNTEVLPGASANGGGNVPGAAAACTADNRNIQEGTIGYWYRFYKGPAGTLQTGLQFSYVVRNTWLGVGGAPKAIDDMWFTSFRYYLPQ